MTTTCLRRIKFTLAPSFHNWHTRTLQHFTIGILLLCKSFCIHCTPCRFSVLYISNIHVYMERMIARTLHIQLHRRTHSIVQSPDYLRNTIALYLTTLAFIVQQLHVQMQDISHDLIYLHHTMITLHRANIVRILLHIRLFRHQFTIQI